MTAAYEHCYATLSENQALLDAMVDGLLEHETLDYQQLEELRATYAATPEGEAAAAPAALQAATVA